MAKTILITGANRGLGYEFARQCIEDGWEVYATCRYPSRAKALKALIKQAPERLHIHKLDLNDPHAITQLAKKLDNVAIDILVNCAGIYGPRGMRLGDITKKPWLEVLIVNTIAPVLMAQAFSQHVACSHLKIIASLSSEMASMSLNTTDHGFIYRSSKAGLNAAMKSVANALENQNIIVLLLHPGWVSTDMGGLDAPLTAEESVSSLRHILSVVSLEDSGKFISFDGEELPW